jgi:hypothetical protein
LRDGSPHPTNRGLAAWATHKSSVLIQGDTSRVADRTIDWRHMWIYNRAVYVHYERLRGSLVHDVVDLTVFKVLSTTASIREAFFCDSVGPRIFSFPHPSL